MEDTAGRKQVLILAIGLGSIGRRHLANVHALAGDADFVVISRSARVHIETLPWPYRIVDSIQEALELSPDAAIVSSATHLHAEALLPLIAANIPLYAEKPAVADRSQLEAVRSALAAVDYSAPSLMGCNLRFLPSLVTARELCQSRRIGRIVRAHFEAGQWLPDWRPSRDYRESYSASRELGGGVVLDLIHELDAARWFLGEFDHVQADLGQRSGLSLDSEDVAGILLSSQGGPMVSVALDYVSRVPVRRYTFVGEEGTLTWDMGSRSLWIDDPRGRSEQVLSVGAFDIAETYRSAVREFLDAVHHGGRTSQPLEEGLKSMDLALRVKEAATL